MRSLPEPMSEWWNHAGAALHFRDWGNAAQIEAARPSIAKPAQAAAAEGPLSAQITGTSGNDTLQGTAQDDVLEGLGGNDTLNGGGGQDSLYGGDDNDFLIGGDNSEQTHQADLLYGGPGNDTMVVDILDTVVEAIGQGLDNVSTIASYTLTPGAEVEVVSLADEGRSAPDGIILIGNEFGQSIIGGVGSDYIDGGGGVDLLQGRNGNDHLIVDADDLVLEERVVTGGLFGGLPGGFDNVAAKESYVLNTGAWVEILSTTNHQGTMPINLTGNEIGQRLIGNAASNYLVGGGGADVLQGLGGDDTMIVDGDDRVEEASGGGHDNVASSSSFVLTAGAEVEVLSTSDHLGTAPIDLTGNAFGQTIIGNAGANQLNGGLGIDSLQGLGGADTFAFTTATVNDNIDFILDFVTTVDRIALDNAVFTGLADGALPAEAFRVGTAAQDADDRIVYDPATGILLFDPDGTGSAVAQHFVTLPPATPIVSSDFVVI